MISIKKTSYEQIDERFKNNLETSLNKKVTIFGSAYDGFALKGMLIGYKIKYEGYPEFYFKLLPYGCRKSRIYKIVGNFAIFDGYVSFYFGSIGISEWAQYCIEKSKCQKPILIYSEIDAELYKNSLICDDYCLGEGYMIKGLYSVKFKSMGDAKLYIDNN